MIEYENLVQLNAPFFEEYKKVFSETLETGWFVLGKNVIEFEKEFAAWNQAQYGIGVANGLDALYLALKSFDFPKGSEVLVPSNTYIATILAILNSGLKPVLVEPDIKTYNMDPSRLEDQISSKTKAVMVVHLYGKACDMAPILELCEKHHLALVEDCAQSHGAKYKNKKTGTFGIGAFSFYPTKNLGALGDAGALITNDSNLAEKLRTLRNYGSKIKYHNELVGINSRLDEVQASFLRVKLKYLDQINNHKRKLAQIYHDNIPNSFIKPQVHPDYFDVYHIYNIRHKERDRLKDFLLKNNIKTDIHYPIPPHQQVAMKGILAGDFPISEEIHRTTLSLPISTVHKENDILTVCEALKHFERTLS